MQESAPKTISINSLDEKITALDQKFDRRIDELDQKFNRKIEQLDSKFDKRIGELDRKFGGLDAKIDALDSRMDSFENSQRKMGVLMEAMDGKMSLMLEGYVGHDARITRLERFAGFD